MIKWNVTEQEADYIIKVLSMRPLGEVKAVFDKLMEQANGGAIPSMPPNVSYNAPEEQNRLNGIAETMRL